VSSRPRRRPPPEPPPSGKRWWQIGRRQEDTDARSTNGRHPASLADEQERLIIEALADLRNRDVREVMTPRLDVVPLKIPVHVEDVARAVRESGHSSFPVVHDDLDDLVGVLFVTDLFRTRHPSSQEPLPSLSPIDISRRVRPAHVVPESRGILDTLAEMRAQRKAFAVVVDEYGGIAGVLTVKDLLEPLVGDLNDEFDQDEGEIVRVDASRWLIDGRTSPDDVRDRLGIDVPEGEYVTLGGYLFDAFGHIPEEGEVISTGGWDLRVFEMEKRRVAKVLAQRSSPHRAASGNGTGRVAEGSRSDPTRTPAPTPLGDSR